ncbi:MAG: hypothetical protein ACREN3_13695, partial [Gemmatimonadaceae bacterium]
LVGSVVLGDGYHLGVGPMARLDPVPAGALSAAAEPEPAPPLDSVDTPATPYSPWRTLWPRYWMPVEGPSLAGGVRLGAFTSGSDVIGRHTYDAQVLMPTDNSGLTGYVDYTYAGLGMPLIVAGAQQDWENAGRITDTLGAPLGVLRKRTRTATFGAAWVRPRYRTASSLSLQGGLEAHDFGTDPAPLLPRLDASFRRTSYYPMLVATAAWSNTQYPVAAVSPEDGLSSAVTVRERFLSGSASGQTFSAVGTASAYKSLDLPGFAHQVLAISASGGVRDERSTDYFEVGGTSGSTLVLAPGVLLGEGQRSFPIRGFEGASLVGIRAYAASAEYRVPLALMDRGWGLLPFFLGRSSLSVFYDRGSAWCPAVVSGGVVCGDSTFTHRSTIASAGAELNVTAAVMEWDSPYRLRFGVAFPSQGRSLLGVPAVSTYFSLGLSF